ncbi:MAG: PilZ domain-containing protein [Candidatus Omnitrophota bacterium]
MAAQSGFDNRKFQRAVFRHPVKYKTSSVEIYAGHLAQDISMGGMRINSNEFVPIGTRVILQVQLKVQEKLLDLEAKVVWVKQSPFSEGYQLGLEFVGGSAFERLKIAEVVVKPKQGVPH